MLPRIFERLLDGGLQCIVCSSTRGNSYLKRKDSRDSIYEIRGCAQSRVGESKLHLRRRGTLCNRIVFLGRWREDIVALETFEKQEKVGKNRCVCLRHILDHYVGIMSR